MQIVSRKFNRLAVDFFFFLFFHFFSFRCSNNSTCVNVCTCVYVYIHARRVAAFFLTRVCSRAAYFSFFTLFDS